ncbi:helix-turn-helix domain-containing protein [uncultured Deinococcus sp.]|uniref:helix-turn-helix domain-containing protein n=1 Tax=uncultured Deinococcus sp. TaxID=158789 RepID=UPI00345C4C7F
MERQNLSARRLAARLGVTKETVLDFIHGRRKTQPAVRTLICRELGLDSVKSSDAA